MKLAVMVCVVVLSLVACGEDPAPAPPVANNIEGVVINVESTGLDEVTSFDIRHDDEETTVYIDEDHDYGFPLGHLNEHLSSGDPVLVTGEVRDGRFYAESIEDV